MYRFLVILLFSVIYAQSQIVAFPGAEGFGAYSKGGRGGQILFVTNLNDYNPENEEPIVGSLRWACDTYGPRTVIFKVSGLIELKTWLTIFNPFITIAGQSSPGDGICLKNFGLSIRTHDVIIRYLRCRPGDEMGIDKEGGFETDAISISEFSENVIIDHCSASWSIDETLSIHSREPGNPPLSVTVQWCIISESLNDSYHPNGPHGYGSLIRFTGNASFHHNLYAHHFSRNPHVDTYLGDMTLDFRNNVIYNYWNPGNTMFDPINMNYVANYIKPGIDTKNLDIAIYLVAESSTEDSLLGQNVRRIYPEGNILEGKDYINQWDMFYKVYNRNKMDKPFEVANITTELASDAFENVLMNAGATLPNRDSVDFRIIADVRNGTGSIIDSQSQVGGWPNYKSAVAPIDNDNDGLPDEWEIKYGLDPANNLDNNLDNDKDGYTNIEEWLNGTIP
jgi:pectate lyase